MLPPLRHLLNIRTVNSTIPTSIMDPALSAALNLPPSQCTLTSHGGSGFSSTHQLSAPGHPPYFVKIGRGSSFSTMFAGEHHSLNAIHSSVPSLCPASIAHGRLEDSPDSYFLMTQFLDLSGRGRRDPALDARGGESLAAKLGRLHSTPAPVVEEDGEWKGRRAFGFPVPTCCGDTQQENGYRGSWAEFYAENRLRAIMRAIREKQGEDSQLSDMVERTAGEVVPRLLGDGHLGGEKGIAPVVVHGDLWSGNASRGRIGESGKVEELVFDPSSCYAHSEFDLGIMRMFGGFGKEMMEEYHGICPKMEPVGEYEDRVGLYELYHHLNHTAIFGGSYRSGAMAIMRRLVKKYGES